MASSAGIFGPHQFVDPCGSKIVDIQQHVLYLRPEHPARAVKTFFRSPPFARPDEFIDGEHTTGTTAFRFKGECPIPSPNVEDRFAVKVIRQAEVFDPLLGITIPGVTTPLPKSIWCHHLIRFI
jgi:hypothetical protein